MTGAPTHCMVITTTDSRYVAERLAGGIVQAGLGACVQVVGPVTSVYQWGGAVRHEEEWQLLVKTTTARLPELTAHLEAEHPYDVPEVIATPIIGGSHAYLQWVTEETANPNPKPGISDPE